MYRFSKRRITFFFLSLILIGVGLFGIYNPTERLAKDLTGYEIYVEENYYVEGSNLNYQILNSKKDEIKDNWVIYTPSKTISYYLISDSDVYSDDTILVIETQVSELLNTTPYEVDSNEYQQILSTKDDGHIRYRVDENNYLILTLGCIMLIFVFIYKQSNREFDIYSSKNSSLFMKFRDWRDIRKEIRRSKN